MKRKCCLIFLLAGIMIPGFFLKTVAGQNGALIKAGTVTAAEGQTVELPVFLQCPPGVQVAALQFDLLYDPRWVDILSIQPGESTTRAEKQLVFRSILPSSPDSFRGNAGEPQYLDMRRKASGPIAQPSADAAKGASSGRERVVIAGMNTRSIETGQIARITLRLKSLQDRQPLQLQVTGASAAAPDAKMVEIRVESGRILPENGGKSRSVEK